MRNSERIAADLDELQREADEILSDALQSLYEELAPIANDIDEQIGRLIDQYLLTITPIAVSVARRIGLRITPLLTEMQDATVPVLIQLDRVFGIERG